MVFQDVDNNGHVDPLEFLEFFENMSKTRGRKAAEGLLSYVQKGVEKLKVERLKQEEVLEDIEAEDYSVVVPESQS